VTVGAIQVSAMQVSAMQVSAMDHSRSVAGCSEERRTYTDTVWTTEHERHVKVRHPDPDDGPNPRCGRTSCHPRRMGGSSSFHLFCAVAQSQAMFDLSSCSHGLVSPEPFGPSPLHTPPAIHQVGHAYSDDSRSQW
jgi:hypothetical protein